MERAHIRLGRAQLIFPTLVPRDAFSNAVTWNNSFFQIGSVVGPGISGLLVAHIGFPVVYVLDAIFAFSFFLLVLPIPARQDGHRRSSGEKSVAQSCRRFAIRLQQESDPGHDHARFVRRAARRRDRVAADLRRSNPALRPGRPRLDARVAGHRRVCDGAHGRLFAADEARGKSIALVRHRFWNRDYPFRFVENALVINGDVVSSPARSTASASSFAARSCSWLRRTKCAAASPP